MLSIESAFNACQMGWLDVIDLDEVVMENGWDTWEVIDGRLVVRRHGVVMYC